MVKSLAVTVAKWAKNTAQAQQDYTQGVQSTTKDWNARTQQAAGSWATGVQDAINNNAFANGVAKVSTAEWKRLTAAKSANWLNGTRVATPKYQKAMAENLQNIASIVSGLPARGPRRSEQNVNRMVAFIRGMIAAKGGTVGGSTAPTQSTFF